MSNETGKNKIPLGITFSPELLEKIDSLRGDVSRSRFILRMLEKMFNDHLDEVMEYVKKQRGSFQDE